MLRYTRQKMDFFDDHDRSVGTLTSMVLGDPKQLTELLGINMAMVLNSCFQLVGTLIISFVFGWKLSLVALFVTVPLLLGSGWYRTKYEHEFVKMSAAVSFPFLLSSFSPHFSCSLPCRVSTRSPSETPFPYPCSPLPCPEGEDIHVLLAFYDDTRFGGSEH